MQHAHETSAMLQTIITIRLRKLSQNQFVPSSIFNSCGHSKHVSITIQVYNKNTRLVNNTLTNSVNDGIL